MTATAPSAPHGTAANPSNTQRGWQVALATAISVAVLWRVVLAVLMPVIARDGVTFCRYAAALGEEGPAFLRSEAAAQHPLFPALILLVQRGLLLIGIDDTPQTWQFAGQLVALSAGVAVIFLGIAVTQRTVALLAPQYPAQPAAVLAALFFGFLPLNVALSADVMSDQPHLAAYLLGIFGMLRLRSLPAAALVGLAAGLAFLTRPEGGVVLVGGLVAVAAQWRTTAWPHLIARAVALGLVFAAIATPYWAATGALSSKKNPLDGLHGEERTPQAQLLPLDEPAPLIGSPAYARLDLVELPPAKLLPYVFYKLGRAGRVVVPIVGLVGLWLLRRRLLSPALAGPLCCALTHLALVTLLLAKWHYLSTRHLLVLVALLTPPAIIALLALRARLGPTRRIAWRVAVGVGLAPLIIYSLRLPNGEAGYLRDAAVWLRQHDPSITAKRIIAGSSPQRTIFYAGARPARWHENDQVTAAQLATQIRDQRPDYFVIEFDETPDAEHAGNADLIADLQRDPTSGVVLTEIHRQPVRAELVLVIYAVALES